MNHIVRSLIRFWWLRCAPKRKIAHLTEHQASEKLKNNTDLHFDIKALETDSTQGLRNDNLIMRVALGLDGDKLNDIILMTDCKRRGTLAVAKAIPATEQNSMTAGSVRDMTETIWWTAAVGNFHWRKMISRLISNKLTKTN